MVQCEVCNLELDNLSMPGHKSGHVRRGELLKRDYTRKCEVCDKLFANGRLLWDHKRILHKEFSTIKKDATRKRYLIAVRGHRCEVCKLDIWCDKSIPIELDHIDGNPENNVIENLRLICPNCHAQTDTYKGKNVGRVKNSKRSQIMRHYTGKYR